MLHSENDIYMMYQAKCNKYKADQLTEELKAVLMFEAVNEAAFMNYVNNRK